MRIIDVNCMLGSWIEKQRFLTEEGLIKALDSYRMESGVAFSSYGILSPAKGNSMMRDASTASNGRIRPCYIIDPLLGELNLEGEGSLFERLKIHRPSAVRMFPNKNGFLLDDFFCGEILDIFNSLHMPVLLDGDQTPSYDKLPGLAKKYCNIRFVLLRQSFKHARYLLPLISKLDNIYVDTGIMVDTGLIEETVRKYGSHRLVFGSGMPYYQASGSMALILYAEINDSDKANIFALNWERIERGIRYGN